MIDFRDLISFVRRYACFAWVMVHCQPDPDLGPRPPSIPGCNSGQRFLCWSYVGLLGNNVIIPANLVPATSLLSALFQVHIHVSLCSTYLSLSEIPHKAVYIPTSVEHAAEDVPIVKDGRANETPRSIAVSAASAEALASEGQSRVVECRDLQNVPYGTLRPFLSGRVLPAIQSIVAVRFTPTPHLCQSLMRIHLI